MTRKLYILMFFVLILAVWLSLPAFAQEDTPPKDEPTTAADARADTTATDDPAAPPENPDDPEQKEQHKCIVTRMPWEESPTRVEAIFVLDGESLRGYFVNLAYMYMLRDTLVADNHTVAIAEVQMLDYPTFGTDHEQMITVNKFGSNIHLILIDQAIDGTKAPYILAYSNGDAAREAIDRDHGQFQGEYIPWDKAIERILQALEAEPEDFEPSDAMGE